MGWLDSLRDLQKKISESAPRPASLQVQTSCYGRAIPLVYGRARLAPNLLWYGDTMATPHFKTQEVEGGKGGGGKGGKQTIVTDTSYTYTTSLIFGICHGTVSQVVRQWYGKNVLNGIGAATLFSGDFNQSAWSYLVTNHPGEDLTYRGIAYAAQAGVELGTSPSVPNVNFEVDGNQQNLTAYGIYDADPKDIAVDVMTNTKYGVGFPSAKMGDLASWSSYCRASGILLSPVFLDQEEAASIVQRLADISNTGVYFSEGKFKARPYSDEAITGNGASYVPDNTPVYDITDDDYQNKDDPIECARSNAADAFNAVQVKFWARELDYADMVAEAKDQANIEIHGLRPKSPDDYKDICTISAAQVVAQHRLQRALYIRNTYRFVLGAKYMLLEPTDLVTLTCAQLGLDRQLVRITSIEEEEGHQFTVEAEEVPANVSAPATYGTQSTGGYGSNYNVAAGNVMEPGVFEAPAEMSTTGLSVGIAVTGNSANWGGAEIWVSYDNATYKRQAIAYGGARYGTITANMSSAVDQLAHVSLVGNGGQISPASDTAAEKAESLCIIDDEFMSFTDATLTGQNAYDLKMHERGQRGTTPAAHVTGAQFVRVDGAIVYSDPLDLSMIGQQIYFKFLSFNIYGGGKQSLDEVSAYSYTVGGVMVQLAPSDVTGFTAAADTTGVLLSWNDIADGDRKDYEIRQGASWAAGAFVAFSGGTSLHVAPLTGASYTWWIKARDRFLAESANAASTALNVVGPFTTLPSAQVVESTYRLTWSVPASQFLIDHYEVRYGASWVAGTLVGTSKTTIFQAPVNWGGTRTFWVAAVDVSGNVGPAGSSELVINAPSQTTVTAQILDNNVLLYWTDSKQSLPVSFYEIRKGATYGGSTLVGTKQGLFTTVFETQPGEFKYWVTGVDSAGNYGTPASLTATVSAPPNYVLNADYFSAFNGTFNNALLDAGAVYFPVDTTETFEQHFTTHNWATPQDQINAGYTIYIEPTPSSGYYEEVIDYGTTLASSSITVTPTVQMIAGSPTIQTNISISNTSNTGPWTDYNNTSNVYVTNFRWIKVRVIASSTGGDDLAAMTSLETRLDAKLKDDGGFATVNSGDANGTQVNFNVEFTSVTSITVTPQGNTSLNTVYDFSGDPNETKFFVYMFNDSGVRQSGDVSWAAKGFS